MLLQLLVVSKQLQTRAHVPGSLHSKWEHLFQLRRRNAQRNALEDRQHCHAAPRTQRRKAKALQSIMFTDVNFTEKPFLDSINKLQVGRRSVEYCRGGGFYVGKYLRLVQLHELRRSKVSARFQQRGHSPASLSSDLGGGFAHCQLCVECNSKIAKDCFSPKSSVQNMLPFFACIKTHRICSAPSVQSNLAVFHCRPDLLQICVTRKGSVAMKVVCKNNIFKADALHCGSRVAKVNVPKWDPQTVP